MKTVITWVQSFAATVGGPGLFIIAFLDSSFLSLPEINDLLVVSAVMEHPYRLVYYATMATTGSIAGCLMLYALGRRGGEALVRAQFGARRLEQAQEVSRKYGAFAILVPALLPPPAPFKIFVLLAGVTKVPALQFAIAIAVGRGLRYFGIGLLAVWYGAQTVEFLHVHGRTIAVGLAALAALGLAWVAWRRRRGARL